jgi:hypothetical protein
MTRKKSRVVCHSALSKARSVVDSLAVPAFVPLESLCHTCEQIQIASYVPIKSMWKET